jgi:hypothetical protein
MILDSKERWADRLYRLDTATFAVAMILAISLSTAGIVVMLTAITPDPILHGNGDGPLNDSTTFP